MKKLERSSWRKSLQPRSVYAFLACSIGLITAYGQVSNRIVIPNEYSDKIAEGKGAQIDGLHQFTYSRSQFETIGDQEITIHSVALRSKLDGPGSSLDVVVPSIRISMGTFTKEMSQLSAVAENNRGVDFTRVFFQENVGLHFVPAGNPDNFDLVFNLDTPFIYNPKNGQFIFEWQATSFSGRPDARVDFAAYFPPTRTGIRSYRARFRWAWLWWVHHANKLYCRSGAFSVNHDNYARRIVSGH